MKRRTEEQNHQTLPASNNQDGKRIGRRAFVQNVGAATLVAAAAPCLFNARMAHGSATPFKTAESAVGEFYNSLSVEQRKAICLPFEHKLRTAISANWHVRDFLIGDDFYSNEQRALIEQIARKVMSEDGYERMVKQMEHDTGGIERYSVAIFGEPGSGKFQWEMTGRHVTLRADGDRSDQVAFGGPLVYGHGEPIPSRNLYFYQTQKANEVFQALDAEQRKAALLTNAPRERTVQVQGHAGSFPGISLKQLSPDQQGLVKATLDAVLSPYREEDNLEAQEIFDTGGGINAMHMAFYQDRDLENDSVWDVWRIEGPAHVCHFRGAPHVHAYINICTKDA